MAGSRRRSCSGWRRCRPFGCRISMRRERRAYVLADNKLALNAGWDREILAIELQALVDLEFDVELTGFSLAEIDLAARRGARGVAESEREAAEDDSPAT